MAESDVRKLRELYGLWHQSKGGAAEAWLGLLADDVEVFSLGNGAPGIEFTRGGRGKSFAQRYLAALAESWEMLHYEVGEFVSEGDRVVMIGRCAFRHRRTGKSFETQKVDVYTFRDGKVVDFREFYDTGAMREAASA